MDVIQTERRVNTTAMVVVPLRLRLMLLRPFPAAAMHRSIIKTAQRHDGPEQRQCTEGTQDMPVI